ncbi:hypothetical protein HA052_07000 [Chromobacterium haemolyticum]|uniref:Uncharacterized protein n=1 Tax=Chromobacterium fluminis TaxID=3044269 RepID=A0ABX0L1W5_9NEIS|nr:hypothetical protein [Chromobacterium haemolyticum]
MVEFLVNLVMAVLVTAYPLWRIFKRVGLPPYYALLVLVPVLGMLAALWILARSKWPAFEGAK